MQTIQKSINTIKNKTDILAVKLAKIYNFNLNNSILVGESLMSIQICKSDYLNVTNDIALNNNITIVNPEKCLDKLKDYYNIPSDQSLLIIKTNYNKDLNLDNIDKPLVSDSVNLKILDPATGDELNTDVCNDVPIKVKTKIKASQLINMELYKQMINSSIDVFNPSSPSFNDVCEAHIDTGTGFDTTVYWRRKNYFQNLSIVCEGSNCTYAGIDDEDYIDCECYGLTSAEDVNTDFKDYIIGEISVWNFGVFLCVKEIALVIYHIN
jgi:hypothetical protein